MFVANDDEWAIENYSQFFPKATNAEQGKPAQLTIDTKQQPTGNHTQDWTQRNSVHHKKL